MTKSDLSNIISTLFTNGFNIKKVERYSKENIVVNAYKFDQLGAEIRYSILFSSDVVHTNVLETLTSIAKDYGSKPILINNLLKPTDIKHFTFSDFYDFFGGIVNSGLILIPGLPSVLNDLGHNILPKNLDGDPKELHEIYISECLQFILESPTRRYGINRLYEKVPDGSVRCKNNFMLIYDSKAYKNGFEFNSETINSLTFYVQDYERRYSQFFGNIFTVIVVSGHFADSDQSIENRSIELYNSCGKKLTCIPSHTLGDIVQYLRNQPILRSSINWKNIFSNTIVNLKHVKKEIIRIKKDKIY